MKINEFASKIKSKYPEYEGIDDTTLVNKIIEKYPVYRDQIDFDDEAPEAAKVDNPSAKVDTSNASQPVEPGDPFRGVGKSKDWALDTLKDTRTYIAPDAIEEATKSNQFADKTKEIGAAKTPYDYPQPVEYKQEQDDEINAIKQRSEAALKAKTWAYNPVPGMGAKQVHEDKDGATWQAAYGYLEAAEKIKEANNKGLLGGVGDATTDVNTYTSGLKELNNDLKLQEILRREESGAELTQAENDLLDAAAYHTLATLSADPSIAYQIGQSLPESAAFMAQMFATGGVGAAAGNVGGKLAQRYISRYGKKKLLNLTGRAFGQAAAVTGTFGSGNVASDYVSRTTGDVMKVGDGQYRIINQEDSNATALYKATASQFIENLTEVGGGVLSPILAPVKRTGGKIVPGVIKKAFNSINSSEIVSTMQDLTKRMAWDGIPEEYFEEVVGTGLNSIFVGDSSFSDLIDVEQQLVTLGSVALMSGTMGSVQGIGYGVDRYKTAKEVETIYNNLSKAGYDPDAIIDDDGKFIDPATFASMSIVDKKLMAEYYVAKQRMEGLKLGVKKRSDEAGEQAEQSVINNSNIDTNTTVRATIDDSDEEVAVIGGDYTQGDDAVLTIKREDGVIEQVSAKRVKIIQVEDTEELAKKAKAEAAQEILKQEAEAVSYRPESMPVPGKVVTIAGEKHTVTSVDGESVMLTSESGMSMQMGLYEVRDMIEDEMDQPVLEVGQEMQLNNITMQVLAIQPDGVILKAEDGSTTKLPHDVVNAALAASNSPDATIPTEQQQTAIEAGQASLQSTEQPVQGEGAASTTEQQAEQPASGVDPVQAEGQEVVKKEYPRDKEGNIDYDSIQDHNDFGNAMIDEFGADTALLVIDEQLTNIEKQAAKAGSKGDAIAKARAKKKYEQERNRFIGARKVIEAAIEAKQQAKLKQEIEAAREVAQQDQTQGSTQPTEKKQEAFVPEFELDRAEDARARGFRNQNGNKVYRSEEVHKEPAGAETTIKFGTEARDQVKGRYHVVEVNTVHPSHTATGANPMHFIPEAQLKNRAEAVSNTAAEKIARKNDPIEITNGVTAFVGTPIINTRGEAVQGNNRSRGLAHMYKFFPDNAEAYKQYLIDNASRFGIDPQMIAGMKNPVLVRVIDVNDNEAIRLGNKSALDTESGGEQRIDPVGSIQMLGDSLNTFANILYRSNNEEDAGSLNDTVRENGKEALKFMLQKNAINDTQYASAFDTGGNLKAEAVEDLINISKAILFQGGKDNIDKMFKRLPDKAKKAILQTIHRDQDGSVKKVLQEAIEVYYLLSQDPSFSRAKSTEDTILASLGWYVQAFMDFAEGSYIPKDRYSPAAVRFAATFKSDKQTDQVKRFNAIFDAIDGVSGNLFESVEKLDPEAAIRKYLDNLERYEQFKSASTNASGRGRSSQEGGSGVPEDSGGTNQRSQKDGDADTGRVTASASRTEAGPRKTDDQVGQAKKGKQANQAGDQVEQTRDQVEGQARDQVRGQAEQAKQADQAEQTTKTKAKTEGATQSKIKSKIIEQKEEVKNELDNLFDSFEDLSDSEKNFSIIDQTSEKQAKVLVAGTRVIAAYTKLGIYKFADIITDIVKQGRDISEGLLNAIKKAYAMFLIDNDIDGLDDVRTVRSFTIDDLNRIKENQKNASKEDITEQEDAVDTNPTDAQKEAGNYKKGHVRISGMDITIEQPKGSIRSGVDANGREWSNTMQNTYGYFKRTQGKDGDQIDVFLGDNVESDKVFVIDQKNPDTGEFDESKVMVGFDTAEQAKAAYMSNYEAGWGGFMAITEQSVDNFKKWLYDGAKQRKPFSEYVGNKKEDTSSMDLFDFADHIAKNQSGNAANPQKNTNLDTTTKTDNTNNQQNVPNQSRPSEQGSTKSSNVDKVDKEAIPGERGRSGGNGNQSDGSSKKGNKQKGSKGGSGLFTDLFGEQSDNDVRKPNTGPGIENDGTGGFDGRGSSINGTKGIHDDSRGHDADKGSIEKAAGTFAERIKQKLKEQKEAESIPVIPGDITNIRETLPFLLKEQQEDVLKAEKRFTDPKHQTKELGNGKGILFTNGTGTGKTYVGLGIVKRFVKQGKTNILIVTPSQPKVNDWAQDGKNLNLEISPLPDTSTGGTGIVVTTFANFRENDELKKREFDLVIYDESHRLMEEKNGNPSSTTHTHYQITNRDVDTAVSRLTDVHPVWIEYKEILDELRRLPNDISGDMMDVQYDEIQDRRKVLDNRIKELNEQKKELLPGLTEKAKESVARTKVVFLSATPFKGHFNLRYVNGYLFNWGDKTTYQQASRVMSRVDPESRFFLDNFGSAYEWKYHRLQSRSNANSDAIAMQEVQFAEKLMDQGVMSGRAIESEMDYERSFPKTTGLNTDEINKAFNDIFNYETNEFSQLRSSAREVFYNYNYTTQLFESLKAATSIERIQKHLDMGRKVVVFHRRKQGNTTPPFSSILEMTRMNAVAVLSDENSSEESRQKATDALNQIEQFRSKYDGLLEYEQTLNYDPAVKQLSEAFEGRISFMNGDISKKEKQNAISNFNKDGSGIDIILVQEDSGKEGISLHDTSGKHQRVLMSLSMPISSITALQIEGRIYRIGQETDAIFEYPLLGLDLEVAHFGQNINRKLSTTENLAVGNQSRDLIRSFAEGVLFNSNTSDPNTDQGKGGKEFDKKAQEALSEFRKAVLVYNTNQKLRGRRDAREGVDYYPTPEPVGQKMVEWLGLQVGETAMEPSAGHGAIAMWFPSHVNATVIEPAFSLFSKLNARSGGGDVKALNERFEDHHIINKYNGIAMNPPFGTGGSMAMQHIEKAFNHLKENGRIVALIPNGGSMQRRLDDFLYGVDEKGRSKNPNAHLIAEITLPSVTFEQAGTAVNGKIIVIDKISDPDAVENIQPTRTINLSDASSIDDLFNGIEHVSIPVRNVSKESTGSNVVEVETSSESILKNVEEYTHTKTGATLYNVPLNKSIDNMSSVSRIAGRHNAYNKKYPYSYYSKGFLFKSKEDAIRFKNEVDGETNSTNDEVDGNSILNEPAPILNEAIQMQIDWDAQEEAEPFRRAKGFTPSPDSELNNSYVHKRKGVSNYERMLSDRGYLDFMGTSLTGPETITGPDDIAFIMKNLQSAPSENSFMVFIDKDGGYKVVYMCTGAQTQTIVDTSIIAPAIEEFKAKKVCMVHNHPSGNLNKSNDDVMVHKRIKTITDTLGVELMDSIIINLDTGKYARFNSNTANAYDTKHDEISDKATVKPVKVYQFDRAVLYSPSASWTGIQSPWDIATFLSTQKRGVAKKIQVVVMNNKFKITAYYLEDGNISDDKLAAGIMKAVGKHGTSVALSTNSDRFDSKASVLSIQDKIKAANIQLVDVIVTKEDSDILRNYKSFADEGMLREDASGYEDGTKEDSDIRFRKVSDNGFYSTVEDALERIKQDKGTPEQFKAMLLKNGAKQAELDWMGWDDFASDINAVTKADIQDWIDQNRIEVEEVQKARAQTGEVEMGEFTSDAEEKYNELNNIAREWEAWEESVFMTGDDLPSWKQEKISKWEEDYGSPDRIREYLLREMEQNPDNYIIEDVVNDSTKYSEYVEPGGENYKELLLTMPIRKILPEGYTLDKLGDLYKVFDKNGNVVSTGSNAEIATENALRSSSIKFQSGHFNEPNILAHIRFNERTVNGERVLFLEEVQSDWAQEGKKKGFKSDSNEDEYNSVFDELVRIRDEKEEYRKEIDPYNEFSIPYLKAEYPRMKEMDEKENQLIDREHELRKKKNGVPSMPFQKTDQWVNLALRRMMRYAAENGFDRIAWTTGEQQAARYDLSKQVDSIVYTLDEGIVRIYPKFDPTPIAKRFNNQSELADIVGKDIADKIYSKEGIKTGNGDNRELKGLDLKVGGEGMKAFYDTIIPKAAGKLGKPFGAKVEAVELPMGSDNASSVQSIPVTDAMTQSVQQGVPLFKEHEYGELHITDAAKQSQIEAFFDKVSKEANNAGPVHVIRSRNELPSNVKNVIPNDARVPGLHITSTGESYFILDEIKDVDEAFKTWVHEVGVHGGLRNIIPAKLFNSMMAKIYDDLRQDEIRRVLPSNYWDLPKHVQAEEYMAHLAEQILEESDLTKRERNAWQKIIEAVYNVLNKLFRNAQFTKKDVENLILASVQSTFTPGNPGGMFPGGAGKGNNQSGVRLKSVKDTREEIQRLNNEIKKSKFIESAQDKMISVKKLIEEVESSGTKVESWENPYLHENAMTSISTYEIEVYTKNYLEPLIGKYSELVKHLGSEEAAKDYLLAKHGLERNEKMRNDAEEADPEADHSQRDFAGLTSLAERALDLGDADVSELSMEEIEYRFKEFVEQIESGFDTKSLWDSINANTKHTLKKWFDSGMLSKDQYEEIRSMYEYYIPLRGFEEETAGDVYEYMKSNNDNSFQSVVKKAKGRKSLAADPLANISSMATSSIIGGNKNQVKQRLLWMARNHKSPVYNVSQVWYVNNGTNEDPLWVEAFPPLTGQESVEERNEIIDAFNRGMKEKEEAGTATTKRKGLRVGLKIGKAQAEEHQIVVFELGKKYVININGDPSVAQAINGTNKYDFRKTPVGKTLQWANRQMAANFTTRNPTFIVRNFVRDVTYASSMHNVREGREYSNQFKNNIPVAMGAAWRYLRGKGNDSIIDKNFIDFLANGGETGYVNLQSFRDHEKKIKRMIKEVNGTNSIAKGVHAVMEAIEMLNRWAELISRFATYQTSLDMGRNIEVSIANSKDSTVNFNRKGTGKSLGDDTNFALRIASYALPYLSSSQLFFNASVQGLANFVDAAKKKPGRFAGTLAKYTAVGMVTPIVSAMLSVLLGGGDDEDSIYWDIPTYVRRNNFVLCFGNKYIAIPLPIELRAFYGLGEILSTQMMGKGLNEEPVTEALYGFMDAMIPVEVGQTAFRKLSDSDSYYMGGVMPDFMVPMYESYVANENWLGYKVSKDTPFNHYAPQFQKVYSGTNKWLVKSSEMLNTISGGDPVGIRGSFDPILLNPAKIEHLLESYFGGVGKTVNQVAKVTTSIIENAIGAENPQNLELRDIPVLSGFTGSISDERIMQAKRNEFYGFRDQYEKYLHDVRKLRDLDDLYESSKRISEIAESDHGRRMQFYGERKKAYDKLYKRYKELEQSGSDSFSLELINDQMNEIIKQTVEEMRNE